MSSVGLTGLSNISSDALQARYQKALKQINKLIEINRQLKESSNKKESEIAQLSSQIGTLQQTIRQFDEQNDILQSKYMELQRNYRQLQSYCKQIEGKMQSRHQDNKEYEQKLRQHELQYHQELQSRDAKYNELMREAELLQQMYQESLTGIQRYDEKVRTLEQENYLLSQKSRKLQKEVQRLSQDLKQNCNQDLRRKLDQANALIQKLMKQCSQLRTRQIDFQVLEERHKVERSLGFSLVNDPRKSEPVKQLINQYRRKICLLETDKKQLQGKYKNLKHKLNASTAESNHTKVEKLERLTDKQQMEIAKLIETYDKQINYMFKENMKLKQGLYSLSYRFKQKSMDLQQKEKQLSELQASTQRVSFENQSLKKLNHSLVDAKSNAYKEFAYLKNDFSQTQSYTVIEKRQSEEKIGEKIKNLSTKTLKGPYKAIYNVQPTARRYSKPNEKVNTKDKIAGNYPNPDQPNFRFIQSLNIINGYNVNLGENTQHLRKK